MSGYIKIYRVMQDWVLYKTNGATHLLNHLILNATYKEYKADAAGEPVILKAGQLITGRKQLAEDTGLSEQQIRTLLGKFEKFGEITRKSTNKYSIITLVKWEQFQVVQDIQPASNQQATSKQPLNKKNKKVKKKRAHSFEDSSFYNKKIWSEQFKNWSKDKIAHYWYAAEKYSNRGNVYKDWVLAVKNWDRANPYKEKKKIDKNCEAYQRGYR